MKHTFTDSYEESKYPMAFAVERMTNTCRSSQAILADLESKYDRDTLRDFLRSCIVHWGGAERYDERNEFAVLVSREIDAAFPHLKDTPTKIKLLKEAFGFASYAHRYLQNELFKVALLFMERDGDPVHRWFMEQELVIDRTIKKAVPYRQYKAEHYF